MEPIHIALIIALIFSVIIHEIAHGYAANWLGDPTARLSGRLTLNPIPHLDPLMSVILPGLLIVTGSPFLFGAAKPVPYNPYNFTNQKWGEAIVAFAGPAANLMIAFVFAMIIRASEVFHLSVSFLELAFHIIILNIFLALLNLVPIPPLDGSKILPRLLPRSMAMRYEDFRRTLERNTGLGFMLVILLFILVLAEPLHSMTVFLATLLVS